MGLIYANSIISQAETQGALLKVTEGIDLGPVRPPSQSWCPEAGGFLRETLGVSDELA